MKEDEAVAEILAAAEEDEVAQQDSEIAFWEAFYATDQPCHHRSRQ